MGENDGGIYFLLTTIPPYQSLVGIPPTFDDYTPPIAMTIIPPHDDYTPPISSAGSLKILSSLLRRSGKYTVFTHVNIVYP